MVFLFHHQEQGFQAGADLSGVTFKNAVAIVKEDANPTHMKVLEQVLHMKLMTIGMLWFL